jgi:SRSO17 transposase
VKHGQIGVFVAYASRLGQAWLDCELYLPKAWTNDPARCRQAGMPEDRQFATQSQPVRQLQARAFAAGVAARWVTGDSVYGDNRELRLWLEAQPQAYDLAVSCKAYVWRDGRQLASGPGAIRSL